MRTLYVERRRSSDGMIVHIRDHENPALYCLDWRYLGYTVRQAIRVYRQQHLPKYTRIEVVNMGGWE